MEIKKAIHKISEINNEKVVVRFAPSPSGYLHIGHVKSIILNSEFATLNNGKFILRFDDTDPKKDEEKYEKSILADLNLLQIKIDKISHSSDYFKILIDKAKELIMNGNAYVDNIDRETMTKNRFHGKESESRSKKIEDNFKIFEKMVIGDPCFSDYFLRAKISIDNPNKALRDPVIYRCLNIIHPKAGKQYIYPTYDFACPIIDSYEGITHAFRTSEFNDRNQQYRWFLQKLNMRIPVIFDISRLSFVYALLSKRKLGWFVKNNLVDGWDDPRMPTIQGIIRRGLSLNALKEYVKTQCVSRKSVLLEWDKIWSLNRKYIDPISPRYNLIRKKDHAKLILDSKINPSVNIIYDDKPIFKEIPLHKKNSSLGFKKVPFYYTILINYDDFKLIKKGEEITIMNWGNVIINDIDYDKNLLIGSLNIEGDFKKTRKFSWIADHENLINVLIIEYNFLINVKKPDEMASIEDIYCSNTKKEIIALGEPALRNVKKGEIIQIERDGFYICDKPYNQSDESILVLISIPDGRVNGVKPW